MQELQPAVSRYGNRRMAVTGWAGVTAPNPKEAVQWIAGPH